MAQSEQMEHREALMLSLIMMLAENAWTLLGKRVDPETGAEHKNLEAARAMIDILDVLRDKTDGRLTEREKQLLQSQLTNLRLNYVEEARSPGGEAARTGAADEASVEEAPKRRIILPGED